MSDDPEVSEEDAKPGGKKPLLIGLVLALLGGGGGFYAVSSGLLFAPDEEMAEGTEEEPGETGEEVASDAPSDIPPDDLAYVSAQGITFVPLEAIVISLPPGSQNSHLRFRAQLEVHEGHVDHVQAIAPRVIDILNSYLRAVDVAELEDHRAFPRLRAQMLRRVQVVAGADAIQNILIQEFILN